VLYSLFWLLQFAFVVVNFLAMMGYKNECGYQIKHGEAVIVAFFECCAAIYFGYVSR